MSDPLEAAPTIDSTADVAAAALVPAPGDAETAGLRTMLNQAPDEAAERDESELAAGPLPEAAGRGQQVTGHAAEGDDAAAQRHHPDSAGRIVLNGVLAGADSGEAAAGQTDADVLTPEPSTDRADGYEQPHEHDGDGATYRPEDLSHLHSGMPLANTAVREGLTSLLVAADTAYFASSGRPDMVQRANDIASKVGEVDGVTVVRPGDFDRDQDNDCSHYTFGEVKGEPWAAPYTRTPKELWTPTRSGGSPQAYLQQLGYGVIDGTPVPGDVVAYTSHTAEEIRAGSASFRHFGVLKPDGRVESKFAQGPVATHWIDHVPSIWGSAAYFLRKSEAERARG